jgi:PAS domain S-box-containing protein
MEKQPKDELAAENAQLRSENENLRIRLTEFAETLEAIRTGAVDALIAGKDVFLLESSEASSNRFRGQVLGQINDVVVACDTEGRITYLNPPAERYYGVAAADALGFPSERLYKVRWEHPEDQASFRDALERYDHWRGEHIHVLRNGIEAHTESSITVLREATGERTGTLAVVRDIGQRILAKQAMEEHARQKDQFLATLAHELRNPLSPITNGLELLKDGDTDAELRDLSIDMMQRQLEHLVRLVDDLLDVSRISRGKLDLRKEPVVLQEVLSMAVEASNPFIKSRGHQLHTLYGPAPLHVFGDPTRLTQIVTNLLNNAAKYTPEGGRIELQLCEEGGQAVVRVKDNGIGLSQTLVERMFDMFYQAPNNAPGTDGGLGIGLNIARRLAIMHKGSLVAESDGTGQGSTFTLRLPLVPQAAPVVPTRPHRTNGVATNAIRILVVDDNRDAAYSLSAILRRTGHQVEVAYDGQEALDKGEAFKPQLVVMDIGMPVLNGYEACRYMKALPWGQAARVVALSGWGQEEDRRKSFDAGFDEHFVKPIDTKVLKDLVASMALEREDH